MGKISQENKKHRVQVKRRYKIRCADIQGRTPSFKSHQLDEAESQSYHAAWRRRDWVNENDEKTRKNAVLLRLVTKDGKETKENNALFDRLSLIVTKVTKIKNDQKVEKETEVWNVPKKF